MSLTQFPLPVEFHKGINPDLVVDPYTKMRQSLLQYAQGLRSIPVPERLELNEAAAMFELWMKDGALHTRTHNSFYLSIRRVNCQYQGQRTIYSYRNILRHKEMHEISLEMASFLPY